MKALRRFRECEGRHEQKGRRRQERHDDSDQAKPEGDQP
jgi:hypothetical protein